jgi:hypothetical protein
MTEITDDYMRESMGKTKPFTIVILHRTPKYKEPGMDKIVWEHGRRNFELRQEGKLCIVCPIRDETDVCGVGIFSTDSAETKSIMDGDPGVKAGIFTYEIHPTRSFPGDSLPGREFPSS